ncbi:low affinity iron permease family protein [Brevundimonas lenta]|uniref:Low affinity Fe/Cu permease n=1 Tax=Brevundimonas lenta TaxID=424796 RepID=A0A7W6JEF3_9CAUL|nr:low affinity iron permease family protein [Brevundimonas lenta]MBB4083633.1 low affinity Fe/Cu permease [Brevundimonas lenta]
MESFFVRFANATAHIAGKPWTFVGCVLLVLLWAFSGPLFKFSETWQLVINTGTTIITFLMVFLIQNTQNRDGAAMQAKLDELIHAVSKADERFIGIEHLTERQLDKILEEVEARADRLHGGNQLPVVATRAEDARAATPPPAKRGTKKAATRKARA